jgi:hypothetical protein
MKTGTTTIKALAAPIFALVALGQAYAGTPFINDDNAQLRYIADKMSPTLKSRVTPQTVMATVNGVFEFGMDTLRAQDTEYAWKYAATAVLDMAATNPVKFRLLICQARGYPLHPLLVNSDPTATSVAQIQAREEQDREDLDHEPEDRPETVTDAWAGPLTAVSYKSDFAGLLDWITDPASRWQNYLKVEYKRSFFMKCEPAAHPRPKIKRHAPPDNLVVLSVGHSFKARFEAAYTAKSGTSSKELEQALRLSNRPALANN